jgi:hypothetical protein
VREGPLEVNIHTGSLESPVAPSLFKQHSDEKIDMKLKLKDKALGMRVWKWYLLLAAWAASPIINLIKGDNARAFELAMYMLLGVLAGQMVWYIKMFFKKRKCKGLINGYYLGRSTHQDGKMLYTRIPIVMPPRSFDFKIKCTRNQQEVAGLLIENLEEMNRLEPHIILFLKSWEDDGEGFPPWASSEEILHIQRSRDEKQDWILLNEASHEL